MEEENEVEVVIPSIEGMSRDEAIFALVTGDAPMALKDAKAYYKDNKPAPRPSFKSRFYGELGEGPMTVARFEELITDEGGNVEAHKSAHKLVLELANEIWETTDDEEEDDSEEGDEGDE